MSDDVRRELPGAWQTQLLEHMVVPSLPITYGVVQPGPEIEAGVPFVRGGDIYNGRIAVDKLRTISRRVSDGYRRTLLRGGELLMSLVGYPGEVAIVPSCLAGANIARQAALIRLDNTHNSEYVMYFLLSDVGKQRIFEQSNGSAQQVVNLSDLKNVRVNSPPLPEQRKIASILTTVDSLIEQTEALIEKYRWVKQGMMADLLSRGVDSDGKLRPTQQQAPELYKQSELGWIPKEWDVVRFGDHISHFDSGWSPVCEAKPAGSGEVGSLKTTSITWDGFHPRENKRLPDDLTPRAKIFVQPDDILITRVGPRYRIGIVAHVGRVANRLMISDNMLRLRLNERTEISAQFVPLISSSHAVQSLWDRRKVGLAEAQMVITQRVVRDTPIPVPPADEQTRILALHSTVLLRIQRENDFLGHLAKLKTGLMQDLLTGKVRVKVDEAEEVAADA